MNEQSFQSVNEPVLVASNIEMLEILDELLGEGKIVRLKIKGRSMLPFLRDGKEQVDISTPVEKELIPGAIVLFKYGGGFLLHRIIKRNADKLLLRGDNIFQSTEAATTDLVLGIVRKIIYPGGRELRTDSYRWKILSRCWLLIKPFYRKASAIKRRIIF
jgi:hypothetical protein